jgi:hypothetical protein
MEGGIQLATSAHHSKVVKRAEQMDLPRRRGDTELLNADVFVAMAAAMRTTESSSPRDRDSVQRAADLPDCPGEW